MPDNAETAEAVETFTTSYARITELVHVTAGRALRARVLTAQRRPPQLSTVSPDGVEEISVDRDTRRSPVAHVQNEFSDEEKIGSG